MSSHWFPLRLNLTGTDCPARTRLNTGRLSTGSKKPEKLTAFTEAANTPLRAVGEGGGERERVVVESELPQPQQGNGFAVQWISHRDYLALRERADRQGGPKAPFRNPGSAWPPPAPTAGISIIKSSSKPSPLASIVEVESPGWPFGTKSCG